MELQPTLDGSPRPINYENDEESSEQSEGEHSEKSKKSRRSPGAKNNGNVPL